MSAPKQLEQGLEALHREAGGVLEVFAYIGTDLPWLLMASASGDATATVHAKMVVRALANIQMAPKREPALCACCPRVLVKGPPDFAIVCALPDASVATQALTFAICGKCAPTPAALDKKSAEVLREFWPESRAVKTTHSGSRA